MHEQTIRSLEQLAQEDPDVSLLALLYRDAVAASDDDAWKRVEITPTEPEPANGIPALHASTVSVEPDAFERLLSRMVKNSGLAERFPETTGRLADVDTPALIRALIEWDFPEIDRLSGEAGIEPPILLTTGGAALFPLMNELQSRIVSGSSDEPWNAGYCPVCGSWPTLAEQRGLEKQLWLRCGRCAAAWRTRHQECIYCGTTDHHELGYMAPEEERESRRVVTCSSCRGYIKVLATVSPMGPGDIWRRELNSIELDVAATDGEYARPDQPGFGIEINVLATASKERSWLPWR